MGIRGGTSQRGQGMVEYVGVVIAIALLVAGLTLWVRSAMPAPTSAGAPPQLTQPLERLVDPFQPKPKAKDRPGRLRRIAHGARVILATPVYVFRGFRDRITNDIQRFIRDPIGTIRSGGGGILDFAKDPIGNSSELVAAAKAYAEELRGLGPEAAYKKLMYDVGGVAADVAEGGAAKAARRAFLNAVKRRFERERREAGQADSPSGD